MAKTPGEKKAFKSGIVKGMDMVEEGLPGWFGTFADMMTLLFAFFVLFLALRAGTTACAFCPGVLHAGSAITTVSRS